MDGFVLIDKEKGGSSFFVVKRIRRILGAKKVGHGGTLDPLATGLLILGIGKATKSLGKFLGCEKEYETTAHFGFVSDTYDAEGQISEVDLSKVTGIGEIEKAIKENFLGEIMQIPPKFSALKIDGKRAYDLARKGLDVTIEPRKIFVQEFKILKYDFPKVSFLIKCGSGTYVRSLVHDLGRILGVGAYVEELRRTKIGDYDVADALKIEEVERLYKEGRPEVFLKEVM